MERHYHRMSMRTFHKYVHFLNFVPLVEQDLYAVNPWL